MGDLQLPAIVDGLHGLPAGEVVGYAAAVAARAARRCPAAT